jgi:hypothetical protein
MNWNYRMVRLTKNNHDKYLELCEVYYDENGKPYGFIDKKNPYVEANQVELLAVHMRISEALRKPILEVVNGQFVEHISEEQKQIERIKENLLFLKYSMDDPANGFTRQNVKGIEIAIRKILHKTGWTPESIYDELENQFYDKKEPE